MKPLPFYFSLAGLIILLPARGVCLNQSQHLKYYNLTIDYPAPATASQTYDVLNYRINLSEQFKHAKIESHYEFFIQHSDSLSAGFINPDDNRLFRLTELISESTGQITYHRLDRLFFTYHADNSTYRFGRQAVTWGNGFVFNVMDIFNPFSPLAIDKEYKTGDDMFYLQNLTEAGNDWQFIYLPRRNTEDEVDHRISSTAIKLHNTFSAADLDFLFASHYNSLIFGLGISHAISESLWRLDITHTETENGQSISHLTTNIDYSWLAFGKNMYGFIEYYYNGIGIDHATDTIDAQLASQIQRGEIFTLYKQHIAAGLRVEIHPLVNLSPTIINNLTDNSLLLSLSMHYNWYQNLNATVNFTLTEGRENSEYAGATSPGDSLQLLLAYYF